ncbi:MAG: helix-turn-helix transcriptional regulator, partial [Acidobacteria bacterium]|nr:helix-turn-helix transcriptional regulator [Acidobacteriota bacterium]MCA1641608.1 helix-turn-helix transcriptional regulator [Acidobacteriota bacterium]
MKSHAAQDKILVGEHCTLHYGRARALRWTSEASPAYGVLLLLDGALRWRAGARAGELSAPSALLSAPGDSVEASGARAETISLSIAPAYVLDCALRARLTRDDALIAFTRADVRDERLARLARDIAEELRDAEKGQELVVTALVEQLVVRLLRRHANVRRAEALELTRAGLIDRRVRRAVELMHAHMERELPLEELASAAYLSPFHFARLFKKVTGASPHAYLAALRIERAKSLLATTEHSITGVATRVGYSSSSHFSKAFRQSTGLTPRAFRAALVKTGDRG